MSRELIFANGEIRNISRGLIFAKSPKIREIAKINPRKGGFPRGEIISEFATKKIIILIGLKNSLYFACKIKTNKSAHAQ